MKLGWVLVVGVLVAYLGIARPEVEALQLEVHLAMDAEGFVRIRCTATPVGPAGYSERLTELRGSLAPETGPWRIVASFSELLNLAPGEERTFVDWRLRLPEGAYTLTWGNPCEGEDVASFAVTVDERGRTVLTAPGRFLESVTPFTVPLADGQWLGDPAARRAAAWARASLAEDLGVCPERIGVVDAFSRLFADASLGVRELGRVYAQVLTSGHVVRLAWEGRGIEYRVAGDNLVRVPDAPIGPVPDEVWVVQVFAYHPRVDLLLHGELACSPAAVLPLPRWVPAGALLPEATFALLVEGGLSPWETEAGYTSEFPLPGVLLAGVRLDGDVLTVILFDPSLRTSGGACRVGILRAQIEKTALQFGAREVRVLPPEALQP